jgi:hypothetical protein
MSTPQLSAGPLRNFNLIDLLATLNGDADAGNQPDLTIDESYTLLANETEKATTTDATTGTAVTNGTWGGDTRGWGFNLYAS